MSHTFSPILIFFFWISEFEKSLALYEIESVAKAYRKRMKQTPSDNGVQKARNYLKRKELVAVPYGKGTGFCVMRKDTYDNKLSNFLDSSQLSESKETCNSINLKIEKHINKELLATKRRNK